MFQIDFQRNRKWIAIVIASNKYSSNLNIEIWFLKYRKPKNSSIHFWFNFRYIYIGSGIQFYRNGAEIPLHPYSSSTLNKNVLSTPWSHGITSWKYAHWCFVHCSWMPILISWYKLQGDWYKLNIILCVRFYLNLRFKLIKSKLLIVEEGWWKADK